MQCEAVRDELALAALGETRALPVTIVDHLATCSACRQAYREFQRSVDRLADALPRVAPPPGLKGKVMARIAAAQEEADPHEAQELAGAASDASRSRRSISLVERVAGIARRAEFWGAAAALLAVVNGALIWGQLQLNREFRRVLSETEVVRSELVETWRAFSGAPAQSVGTLVFDVVDPGEGRAPALVSAEGYLYQRPNGWSVLIQVRGIERTSGHQYDVWLRGVRGWEQVGPLMFDTDGIGTFLYYAREPEVAFESLRVVTSGVLPGTPQWRSESLIVGQAVFDRDGTNDGAPRVDDAW